ncbi:hypothetical protein GCM10027199_36120 [Amycolatopsis magusensis]
MVSIEVGSVVACCAATQSRRNSESRPSSAASFSCSVATARSTSVSTEATGSPAASATAIDIASSPIGESFTRTVEAPVACSDTPSQENGRPPWLSGPNSTNREACSTASSNAGWSSNDSLSTSSGSATSA